MNDLLRGLGRDLQVMQNQKRPASERVVMIETMSGVSPLHESQNQSEQWSHSVRTVADFLQAVQVSSSVEWVEVLFFIGEVFEGEWKRR